MKKKLSLLIPCLAGVLAFYSITSSQANTSSGAPEAIPAQSEVTKVAILQAQLEIIRNYDENLLNTVYWSLGTTVGIMLLVVGLGWYSNFRVYTRDVAEMERNIKKLVDAQKSTVLAELSGDLSSRIASQIESLDKVHVSSDLLADVREAFTNLPEKFKVEGQAILKILDDARGKK